MSDSDSDGYIPSQKIESKKRKRKPSKSEKGSKRKSSRNAEKSGSRASGRSRGSNVNEGASTSRSGNASEASPSAEKSSVSAPNNSSNPGDSAESTREAVASRSNEERSNEGEGCSQVGPSTSAGAEKGVESSEAGRSGESGAASTSTSTEAGGSSSHATPDLGSPLNEGASARERFNQRNQAVTPLRKCSELITGRRYRIINLCRTNTQFGSAVRAYIIDDRSPTGKSFCYLPVRFRSLSDEDLLELNGQASLPDGLHIVYSGRVGKADMIELV